MRRSATAQSPVRASQASARSVAEKVPLHPVLQNALMSLDTQLEDELFRYRRQRALGRGSYTPRSLDSRSLKLGFSSQSNSSTLEAPADSTATVPFHPTATVPLLATIAPPTETTPDAAALELKELAKQYASQVASDSDATVLGGPDDYLESSEELLRTLSQEQAEVQAEQNFMQTLLTPLGLGAMLLLLMTSALFGFVIMNPNSVSQLLNRSESVASNNTNQASMPGATDTGVSGPQPNLANQEFPELTLGNLGAIPAETQGATLPPGLPQPTAIAKPGGQVAHLGASGVAGVAPTQVPQVPAQPQVTGPVAEPAPSTREVPGPRNLAPAPSYNPPPVRAYVPPVRSYDPPPARPATPPRRSYRAPAPVQPYTPPARAVLPTPKPIPVPVPNVDRTPPPPTPTATSTPSASGYKVVTPYTSDQVLEEYRGKVPDAYVKNYSDGAKVQFGAYQDENSAKSQAEELRKQGIPAEVYKP
jgi:hypothetical protein